MCTLCACLDYFHFALSAIVMYVFQLGVLMSGMLGYASHKMISMLGKKVCMHVYIFAW